MAKTSIKKLISTLPGNPGVYKFFNEEGTIIYIGKARNLKNRVSSYFNKLQHENRKTAVMVSKVEHLEYTIVDSEVDALLLENSLIKEFQPRYNINLKDDKSYPFIRITNERFPKVYGMRNPLDDGSEYFGPYGSVKMMETILDLVKNLYPTRNCNYNLSEENIQAGKFTVCLEYQIGNCRGACEGLETEAEYMESIKQIRNILKGNLAEVIRDLKGRIQKTSEELNFELAAEYKQKLDILEYYQGKSTIVNKHIDNVDVYGIVEDKKNAFVNYLKVSNGMIIQTQNLQIKRSMDEPIEELLLAAIAEIRNKYKSTSKEIIVPFELEIENDEIEFWVPKAGEKKKLLDLSVKNALYYKREKVKQEEKINPDLRIDRLMTQMKEDMRLTEQPRHIECFDNSNIQGEYPVSAMVLFRDGKPAKKEYRHYIIRTVEGPNDFASMEEVIYRRYKRLMEEGQSLPQLIVIDGGKGQLSSAVKSLKKLGIYGKIAIVGIAKKLEEIFYPEDPIPLYIDKRSETLKVIQHMRDEAHRFGITHHRSRRDKGTLKTELSDIKGIGPQTAQLLLSKLKSVKKIREASEETIAAYIGKAKAKLVAQHFKQADEKK